MHTEEKLYSCSKCPKSFLSAGCLKHHMRVHTGEKPLNCSICTRPFPQLCILNRHRKAHTEAKPINCSRMLQVPHDINLSKTAHERSLGYKPFSCSECTKSFSRPSLLEQHMMFSVFERSGVWVRLRVHHHSVVDAEPAPHLPPQ